MEWTSNPEEPALDVLFPPLKMWALYSPKLAKAAFSLDARIAKLSPANELPHAYWESERMWYWEWEVQHKN